MSRIKDVIANKNRVEKLNRARRKEEMLKLKNTSAFKARLYDELKVIDMLLDSNEIEYAVIKVPEKYMSMFTEAIYSEDLAEYEIDQCEDEADKFRIKKRFLLF